MPENGESKQRVEEQVLKNLPFHVYWKAKKYFRLHLPQEFINRAITLPTDSHSEAFHNETRNKLLEARWKREISEDAQVPLHDEEINEVEYSHVLAQDTNDLNEESIEV